MSPVDLVSESLKVKREIERADLHGQNVEIVYMRKLLIVMYFWMPFFNLANISVYLKCKLCIKFKKM